MGTETEMSLVEMTVRDFTGKLESAAPAPGGGSAAALSGALGAALVSMVCKLTMGKSKYAEYEIFVQGVLARSEKLTKKLLDTIQTDSDAFDSVITAFAMPKETEEQKIARSVAVQSAYKTAVASPEMMAEDCLAVVELAESLFGKSNANAVSDLAVGAMQAHAGLKGALANVQINLPLIKDTVYVAEKRAWMERVAKESARRLQILEAEIARQLGL
ncbi:MAG: cyclodeaminase/cyclohydrolase family protein [Synergistaceae bacterium]|nr:cyclodeaminase/cyclohydrolase family protein [Synergistaceae bacterium]